MSTKRKAYKPPNYNNVNAANKYARDVVAKKIDVCRLTYLACERHLNDLESQKDPSFEYKFDKNKAERACRFLQMLPHTKGKWKRDRLKITLEPWQCFFFINVFGWMRKATNLRRFREVYLKVPRKNGKSIIAAGVGLYGLNADEEAASEIYCGASTEKQAWEVFKPAKLMVEMLPSLRKRFGLKVHAKKLTRSDGSVFEPVIGKPGDGSSPHIALIDEYHEHDTSDQYDTFDTGMGSREQPMMVVITTAGFVIDGPCYDLESRCVEMLYGKKDDSLFALIYGIDEGDDWTDPAVLAKANPNMGVSVDKDYLISQQQKAINQASFTNKFKVKHLNMWTSAKSAYFNMENWKKCEDKNLRIEHFRGNESVLGVDLARRLDMNAGVRLFWREIGDKIHWYCVSPMFWTPYDQVYNNDDKSLAERYQRYIEEQLLTINDGVEIDFRQIHSDIVAAHLQAPIRIIPLDPHGASQLSHSLQDSGIDVITIPQGYKNFSDPMKELEAAINSGRFHHDGNPILTWHISNVVGRHMAGNDDVVMPIKNRNINKIDGAVALMMAIGEAMLTMTTTTETISSVYKQGKVGC